MIRRMQADDLEQVWEWRNSSSVRRCMFNQDVISIAEHQQWFEKLSAQTGKYHPLIFEKDQISSGFISFEVDNYNLATWGFYKAPNADKGVGLELGVAALKYAFEVIQVHKVIGQVIEYNKKSIDFHVKLNFQQEGVLRDNYRYSECYYDVWSFGLLRKEWEQTRGGG